MRLPSKVATFWILMGASALTAFALPAAWTAPIRNLFQPLALVQWPLSWFTHQTAGAVADIADGTITQERAHELERENAKFRLQIIHQGALLEQVEQQLSELTAAPLRLPDSHARIVIAPVLGYDSDPRRATLQVLLPPQQAEIVRKGQWVASAQAPTPADREVGGRTLLQRQWLIGRVTDVQSRVARIQLTSDPRFKAEVRAAQPLGDGLTLKLARDSCILEGRGQGRMWIAAAVENYADTGYRIIMAPPSADLPMSLSLGWIEGSAPRRDSPQHVDLSVVPWAALDRLTYVYIIAGDQ
jgi:cell shape-determining protein MreC